MLLADTALLGNNGRRVAPFIARDRISGTTSRWSIVYDPSNKAIAHIANRIEDIFNFALAKLKMPEEKRSHGRFNPDRIPKVLYPPAGYAATWNSRASAPSAIVFVLSRVCAGAHGSCRGVTYREEDALVIVCALTRHNVSVSSRMKSRAT